MKKELKLELTRGFCNGIYPENCCRQLAPLSQGSVTRDRRRTTKTKPNCAYYQQFKPVFFILRIVGRYSLQMSDKGEWESNLLSWSAVYCLLMYTLQTYVAIIVCFRRVEALVESQADYDEFIFSIHVLAYLNIHFHVPFTYWLQNKRIARYLNLWAEFQMNWEVTFGQKMELMYKKTVIIFISIIIPAIVLLLCFEQYSTLHDPWLYFLPYLLTLICTVVVIAFWFLTCLELKRLSEEISQKLITSLERRPSGWLLRRWRHLWLDMRYLTESLGTHLSAVLMSIMLTFSTTFLLGLYNGLVQLITFEPSWKAVGYLSASTTSLLFVFAICDAGHRATSGVAGCTLTAILKAKIGIISPEVKHEVFLILESIKAHPPQIQLGGFVTLNRPLVVSLISNTLTYLIVLLQFKVNEKEK